MCEWLWPWRVWVAMVAAKRSAPSLWWKKLLLVSRALLTRHVRPFSFLWENVVLLVACERSCSKSTFLLKTDPANVKHCKRASDKYTCWTMSTWTHQQGKKSNRVSSSLPYFHSMLKTAVRFWVGCYSVPTIQTSPPQKVLWKCAINERKCWREGNESHDCTL